MARPKAMIADLRGRTWVERAISALAQGGCDQISVALGAEVDRAEGVVRACGAEVVLVPDWAEGISASVRAGLQAAAAAADSAALVVLLVDLPDVGADVVRRVLTPIPDETTLRRAVYAGEPGHPVVIGRSHWDALDRSLHGDVGAGPYLRAHSAEPVDCSDLATGVDVDYPPA